MNAKNLFIFSGIVSLIYGVLLLLFPIPLYEMASPLEVTDSELFTIAGQGYGAIVLALGIALLTSAKASKSYGRRGFLLTIAVADTITAVIIAKALFDGLYTNLAMVTLALVVLQAAWAGLLLPKEWKVD
ncbi:MAG: hypothetical protein OEM26_05085 [Saprospiraceae bacterium]|nr:hypothetical protein [Saprospiraceae bacterium]